MTQVELFPDAPIARPRPQEPIVRSAEIDGEYRWDLRRAWGAGPPVAWVLLNPSVADGKTASGAPIHPLARGKHRIPNDQKLVPWK